MIRSANETDIVRLFDWRNNPEIVKLGNGKKVKWNEHLSWFANALKSENIHLYIIEPNAGSVRLEKDKDIAIISIYLLKEHRNKGLGLKTIEEVSKIAFEKWEINRILAYIHRNNKISIKVFQKAGFKETLSNKTGYRKFVYGR